VQDVSILNKNLFNILAFICFQNCVPNKLPMHSPGCSILHSEALTTPLYDERSFLVESFS